MSPVPPVHFVLAGIEEGTLGHVGRWLLPAIVILYGLVHLVVRMPVVLDPYVSVGGMVNWTGEVHSSEQISTRASLEEAASESYFSRQGLHWSSPGHTALLSVFRTVGDPVRLSKGYPLVLAAFACLFAWGLGRRLGGPYGGLFAAVLFLHMPALYMTLYGIPVSWTFPLLLAFLFAEERGATWAAVLCVCLAGLFYPVIALVCLTLFAVRRVRRDPDSGRWLLPLRDRSMWAMFGAGVLTMMVASPPWGHQFDALFRGGWMPEMISYEEMIQRQAAMRNSSLLPPLSPDMGPEFDPYREVLTRWGADVIGAALQPLLASGVPLLMLPVSMAWMFRVATAVALLASLVVGIRLGWPAVAPPRLVVELVLVSLGLYLLSVLMFPWMFFPQRYVAFSLPIASLLYVVAVAGRALEGIAQRWRTPAAVGAVAALLLLMGSGVPFTYADAEDYRPARGVLEFVAGLDEDVRVAGPPLLMDAVELISKRDTLVYCQEAIMTGHMIDGLFYEVVYRRLQDLQRAYYATELMDVVEFCEHNGVDYLVVDLVDYDPVVMPVYEPPCGFLVSAEERREKTFALAGDGLEPATLYEDAVGYRVIRCADLETLALQ